MKRKTSKINIAEYLDLVPDGPDQIHVNHVDCPAGTDKKRRLYIRRKHDGSIVYYCHHCGASGRHVTNKFASKKVRAVANEASGSTTDGKPKLPFDLSSDQREWPVKARAWLYKYRLDKSDFERGHIGYSAELGRLVLPVYDKDGVVFWQSRVIDPERDTAPKYISHGNVKDVVCIFPATSKSSGPKTLVIVEDIVSGLRCSRFHDTLVLLGSNMHDLQYKSILTNKYESVKVFLDMDNPHIKSQALTIKRKLDMIVDQVSVIHAERDPKEHSDAELDSILNGRVLDLEPMSLYNISIEQEGV